MATPFNVTNYDYSDLRKRIQEKLRDKEGWGDGFESTVGQNLIDVAADAADILAYMLERRSQESFQTTARLRSSVVSRASELGYRSRRALASSGFLTLQLTDQDGLPKPVAVGGEVVVPEGTVVTFDDLSFYTIEEAVVEAGQSSVEVNVAQGQIIQMGFDTTVDENFQEGQFFLISDYEYIDENSLKVVSNNIEYRDVQSLDQVNGVGIGSLAFADVGNTQDNSSSFYDVRYAHDGMRIQFGDNLFGTQPDGDVLVTFVRTDGEKVRVLSTGNEFRFNFDTFGDDVNIVPANEYEYVLTNSTQIIGGRQPETLEEIRVRAPLFITTNNRAVSLEGYGYWAKRSNVGGIIDARAFAEFELDTLLYNINNVYIAYLTEEGSPLSPEQKQQLIDFVKERDVALAHVVPLAADEIQLGIDVSFRRTAELNLIPEDLYVIFRNYIIDYFKRQEGSIGGEYQKSDFIRDSYNLETRVSGVDYKVIDFIDVDINAYQMVPETMFVEEVIVRFRNNGSAASAGDAFTLTIDGVDYTVLVEASDLSSGTFYTDMLFKMRDFIFQETELVPSVNLIDDGVDSEFALRIKARDRLGSFTISAVNGDFVADTLINFQLQVFPKTFNNTSEDILLRENVAITDEAGAIIFRDNGNGFWVEEATGDVVSLAPNPAGGGAGGGGSEEVIEPTMINYVTAKLVLPELPTDVYYIKYKQDRYDNFSANSSAAVTLIEPKEEIDGPVDTFSTISIVST